MRLRLRSFLWGGLVMAVTFALGLFIAVHQKVFVEQQGIPSPNTTAAPAIAYFLGVVAILALVLFFVPVRRLVLVFKLLFAVMYAWGVLVTLLLVFSTLNEYIIDAIAVAAGALWLFWPRVWIQNLLLVVTLAAMSSVFGYFFANPWAFIIVMAVISLYDFLAVRFGLMVWMADRMSQTTALPAFVFPKAGNDWNLSVNNIHVGELSSKVQSQREYSILGGGDIAFPLMLASATFFQSYLGPPEDIIAAVIVSVFALLGLMTSYLIQSVWLKGKPMPALPPITVLSVIGFLITRLIFPA